MANYITTKYGTKINVTGLTPEQIAKVRSVAEDKGAYGTKGAALADTFRKQSTTPAPAPGAPAGGYTTDGKDTATLEAERARTAAEIERRGGAAAAPNYAARLAEIDAALKAGGGGGTGDTPVNTPGGPEIPKDQKQPDQFTPTPVPGRALGVDPETGAIDPDIAAPTLTGAVADDTNRNFQMQNPGVQTDVFGNRQEIVTDPVTGQTSIRQTAGSGLSAANQAFTNAATGWANAGDNAKAAADANYNYITRNYGQDKSRELEATKQELANRGIPLNFAGDPNNPDNLYSRALGSIDQKYQGLYDQANNQALMARDASLSTQAGVIGALGGAVAQQSPGFTAFQGGQSNQGEALLSLLGIISDADMTKYGIDKEMAAKLKAIAASRSSGRGSGSDDSGPIIGGNAPGFGV